MICAAAAQGGLRPLIFHSDTYRSMLFVQTTMRADLNTPPAIGGLHLRDYLLLMGFTLVLFGYSLVSGRPLTMHEARLPQTAREMQITGDYLFPTSGGRPWLERPPLPHWITIAFASITGPQRPGVVRAFTLGDTGLLDRSHSGLGGIRLVRQIGRPGQRLRLGDHVRVLGLFVACRGRYLFGRADCRCNGGLRTR